MVPHKVVKEVEATIPGSPELKGRLRGIRLFMPHQVQSLAAPLRLQLIINMKAPFLARVRAISLTLSKVEMFFSQIISMALLVSSAK